MANKKAGSRKLIVCNPHAIPDGIPLMEYADGEQFFDGDEFTVRPGTTEAMIDRRIAQGYLKEVSHG